MLSVLTLIQSRGRWTRQAIADELGCSIRTVYRDLDVLELAGVPYYSEPPDHVLRVRADYRFPTLNLSDDELLGQALATSATRSPGLDVTSGAAPTTRKLAAASSERAGQLFDDAQRVLSILDLKLADHSKHHATIATVQQALLTRSQVTGLYESPYEAGPVRLRLHPYRLCLVKNAWYLVARPADAAAPRTYRIARFQSHRTLVEPADVPDDFDLQAYFGNAWAVYRGETSYEVEIRFTSEAAKVVTETIWHHTQKAMKQKDGSVVLRFRVDGLEEITNWVLSWTGRCEVLTPSELRTVLANRLRAALQVYQPAC